MKKYLLLDHDGTLFNTEPVALPSLIERFNMLYAEQLSAAGRSPLTLEEFFANFKGLAREGLTDAMAAYYGFAVDTKLLYLDREGSIGAYYATVPGGIAMAPNLIPALKAAKEAGWGLAVVTNNPVVRSIAAMRHADNPALGEELFTLIGPNFWEAGDIQKPKPNVYLRAMAALGVTPEHCVAVEDSKAGVGAAVAAGLRTLGYTGFIKDPVQGAADLKGYGCRATFGDYADLPGMLARL